MLPGDVSKSYSPLESVRRYCVLACMGGQRGLVAACEDQACPLHPLRMKTVPEGFPTRVVRIIRRVCLRCTVGDRQAVRRCTEREACPLWPYRVGVSPKKLKRLIQKRRRPQQLELPF